MHILVPVLAVALMATPATVQQLPPGSQAREARLLSHMGPQARAFIVREGRLEAQNGEASEGVALAAAHAYGPTLGAMGDADIEALAFLVMMEAAKSSQDDLKSIMAEVKAVNTAKSKQRQALADAAATKSRLRDRLDSQGELSQSDSMQLQMATDRRAKAIEMLSNLMKKMSDTQSTIVGNLK